MPITINDCRFCGQTPYYYQNYNIEEGFYERTMICDCDASDFYTKPYPVKILRYGNEEGVMADAIYHWNIQQEQLSKLPVCPMCLAVMEIHKFHYEGGVEHFWMCECDQEVLKERRNNVDNDK